MGRQQVEIDALAALRPQLLEQIAREAIAPYFDHTFDNRFAEATALPDDLLSWFRGLPAYNALICSIRKAHGPARQAIKVLNQAMLDGVAELHSAVEAAEDKPELPAVEIEVEISKAEPVEAVFDSSDDFVTATQKLQAIKALVPDPDEDSDGANDLNDGLDCEEDSDQ